MSGKTEQRGQLIWRDGRGWYGRFYATVEGERMRVCRALGTDNKAIAQRKLLRLIESSATGPTEAKRGETFEEASRRILGQQKSSGMVTWHTRESRLEAYVFPALGPLEPSAIRASHVRSVLETARDLGKARQTLVHIKNDISAVLGDLWRAESLAENVCGRVKVPEASETATQRSKKERAVLTDEELVRYLAWQHPDERQRMAVLERQTMACIARMFGGLRTSDLHALAWDGFDLPTVLDDGAAIGGFEAGIAPRKKGSRLSKGGRPQRLIVPTMLRPILLDWWERHGRPSTGLVFPARRGLKAGLEARKGVSHAKAFRRDLRRAYGADQLARSEHDRGERGPLNLSVWVAARPLTARERELFEETEYTRPVDFHSWRRAFNQALADAGVNAQQAQALAGHASLDAHARYLANTSKAREIPAGALPRLTIGHPRCPSSGHVDHGEAEFLRARHDSNVRPLAPEAGRAEVVTEIVGELVGSDRQQSPALASIRTKCPPVGAHVEGTKGGASREPSGDFPQAIDAVAVRIAEALELAARAGQWATVVELARELQARTR